MRTTILNLSCIVALVLGFLVSNNKATAQTGYSAFDDFSGISNPNGVWSYGFTHTLGGPLMLYTSTVVHGSYDSHLTQWTDGVDVDPNVIKNETGQDISLPTFRLLHNSGDRLPLLSSRAPRKL